ncbi:RimJ/RimL family protein N-acetyltransferase [Crenobacter luteus]|uniref:GNAT family N-acetyltransferase n=1 Tax=Crenobacter luteus TaxID=1452487 RepID=UPI00104CB9C2|nr:GNAT family protein [Crenobacter luteus]TCP15090.1 RimJ/RimL family protein N-acetyltransferase [Crenobacter luteus]
MEHLNALGQPLGAPMPDWTPPPRPSRAPLEGRTVRLEPVEIARHAESLFAANTLDRDGAMWTYLPYGPFAHYADYRDWLTAYVGNDDPLFFAVVDSRSHEALGLAAYLRVDPDAGSIEIGHLAFSPRLQKSTPATEAVYLLLKEAFALGYRRVEWKCDALNAASRRAAERFGFTFEGVFRQHRVDKGRNRDTAWFAMLDGEWPALRHAYQAWLDPANFDEAGRQRQSLGAMIAASRG